MIRSRWSAHRSRWSAHESRRTCSTSAHPSCDDARVPDDEDEWFEGGPDERFETLSQESDWLPDWGAVSAVPTEERPDCVDSRICSTCVHRDTLAAARI